MNPDHQNTSAGRDSYRVGYSAGLYRVGYERTILADYPSEAASKFLAELIQSQNLSKPGTIVMFRYRDHAILVYEVKEVEVMRPVKTLEIV